MTDDVAGNLLPTYFVADESGSMKKVISELNRGLVSLHDAMQLETLAAAQVRFAVLGFSGDATWHLPLSDIREVEVMPAFKDRGSTSYKSAFDELQKQIPLDVANLKSQGYRVHRPAVFFLSDGNPNGGEDWRASLAQLTGDGFKEHPNVVAFGFGDVTPKVILEVATNERFAFVTDAQGSHVGDALAEFFSELTRSIIQSGSQIASGQGAELVVQKPDAFKMAIDLV